MFQKVIAYYIFLSSIYSVSILSFTKPEYCKVYDGVYSLKEGSLQKNKTEIYSEDDIIASYKLNNKTIPIYSKDLLKEWVKVNDFNVQYYDKANQKKILKAGLNFVAKKIGEYEGLSNLSINSQSDGLTSCLNEISPNYSVQMTLTRKKEKESANNLTKDFLSISFDKLLLAKSTLLNISQIEKEYQLKIKNVNKDKKLIQIKSRYDEKKSLKKELNEKLLKYKSIIALLSRTDPLFFDTSNKFELWSNWFQSKIKLSSFANQLLGNIPNNIMTPLSFAIKEAASFEDLENFYEIINETLAVEVKQYKENIINKNYPIILESFRGAVTVFRKDAENAILQSCKNKGEHFHFNEALISTLINEITEDYQHSEARIHSEVIALQAWQCHAWRRTPYTNTTIFSNSEKTALWGLLVGTGLIILSPITGVGGIIGAYLAFSGGGVLTSIEINKFIKENQNYKQEKIGYYAGWRDIYQKQESLNTKRDHLSNIGIDIIGSAFGGTSRFRRVTPSFLERKKTTQFRKIRESKNTINQKAEDYYKVILNAHEPIIPKRKSWHGHINLTKFFSGNKEIPNTILKHDPDFGNLIKTLTNPKGTNKEDALLAINKRIENYSNYQNKLKETIVEGFNYQEKINSGARYLKKLKPKHFDNLETQSVETQAILNQLFKDSDLSAQISPNKLLSFKFNSIEVIDGKFKNVTTYEGQRTYAQFKDYIQEQKKLYNKNFSLDQRDEFHRKSDIFEVIDEQARLFRELEIVRDSLISSGRKINKNGDYESYGDKINILIKTLDDTLYKNDHLLPRKDAVKAFANAETLAERKSLFVGDNIRQVIFRKASGKYSNESEMWWKRTVQAIRPMLLFYGTTYGAGQFLKYGTSLPFVQNTWINILLMDAAESQRNFTRVISKILDSESPVGYTLKEASCAKEARQWTIENDCLMKLLNKNVLAKAGIKERFDSDYDIKNDKALEREIRDYIRNFLLLRRYFAEGKKTDLSQSMMQKTAKEMAEQDLRAYITQDLFLHFEDFIIPSIIELTENTELRPSITIDKLNEFIDTILKYKDNPSEAIEAYKKVITAYSAQENSFLQSPELETSFKTMLIELFEEEYLSEEN